MHLLALPFPEINPEIFAIDLFGFHLALRWYSLAYIAGIVIGWRLMLWVVKRPNYPFKKITTDVVDDFVTYGILGIIIGGRLFGTLVYDWEKYSQNPLEIILPPYAGMSFHGGFLGLIIAVIFVCYKHYTPIRPFADLCALAVPFGLFFGRLANFINDELWGRQTDVAWAVMFPNGQFYPRHPSQLYEAGLEGILLGSILWILYARGAIFRPGLIAGVFFVGYGLARIFVEFFRQPDASFVVDGVNPMGYAIQFGESGITMGQLLSIPMLVVGLYFILTAKPLPEGEGSGEKRKTHVA